MSAKVRKNQSNLTRSMHSNGQGNIFGTENQRANSDGSRRAIPRACHDTKTGYQVLGPAGKIEDKW